MSWTEVGLEALLQLRLVMYATPDYYRTFFNELLDRSAKTTIDCDFTVEATSGKL